MQWIYNILINSRLLFKLNDVMYGLYLSGGKIQKVAFIVGSVVGACILLAVIIFVCRRK